MIIEIIHFQQILTPPIHCRFLTRFSNRVENNEPAKQIEDAATKWISDEGNSN